MELPYVFVVRMSADEVEIEPPSAGNNDSPQPRAAGGDAQGARRASSDAAVSPVSSPVDTTSRSYSETREVFATDGGGDSTQHHSMPGTTQADGPEPQPEMPKNSKLGESWRQSWLPGSSAGHEALRPSDEVAAVRVSQPRPPPRPPQSRRAGTRRERRCRRSGRWQSRRWACSSCRWCTASRARS